MEDAVMWKAIGALALAGAMVMPACAEDKDAKSSIMARLDSQKISLDFKDTGMDEVIDFLHEVTQINFVLSKTVQERVRNGELKVDVKLTDMGLRPALKLMLEMHDLTAVVHNGVLLVQTKEERGSEAKMEILDVKDLLMRIEDFPGPGLELSAGEDGGPTSVLTPPDDTDAFSSPDTLVDIIRNATGGDATWGRDMVSITVQNGLLIIVHNPEVVKEVRDLVIALRQFK
jgi:hypothetical protein